MEATQEIRVIVFREGDSWAAQCLEFDIGAQAGDLDELHTRFSLALVAEYQHSMEVHGKPLAEIDPAPQCYHDMWSRKSGAFQPTKGFPEAMEESLRVDMALCA